MENGWRTENRIPNREGWEQAGDTFPEGVKVKDLSIGVLSVETYHNGDGSVSIIRTFTYK